MDQTNKYKKLYSLTKKIKDKYNPCAFSNGICVAGKPGCCSDCSRLRPIYGECTVSNLACSLWYCEEAKKAFPRRILLLLENIWLEAEQSFLLLFDASEEEVYEAISTYPRYTKADRVTMSSPTGRSCTCWSLNI